MVYLGVFLHVDFFASDFIIIIIFSLSLLEGLLTRVIITGDNREYESENEKKTKKT